MGNEASRGLSPGGALPASPHGGLRRAKSFSTDAPSPSPSPSPGLDRSIQRMDKTIRKRVRGGITYNMKIILRGDRGTGKTSLFQRLKGEPIPSTHETTPQLQSATINWSFRANSEESVKCDVWDVVDKGVAPEGATPEGNPFEAAASAQGNGAHMVATVDATTVDVYHETHGVVFLLDVTKPHTLEYVRQHLDQVPVHIPTLVLGNFRDCGAQRKIFKEDIQELLYGGAVAHHQPVRRPHELLYFECSLLNCYGLKSLHQYFGIPFLQLKQQTVRQQLRILEGEFTHLKHDLQAKISEQKYADYLDHIKASGSDIRTGRRAAAAAAAAAATAAGAQPATTTTADAANDSQGNGDSQVEEDSPTSKTRLDRTLSSSSDIVIHSQTAPSPAVESPVVTAQSVPQQVDLEDLPERTAALAQAGNSLKIDYTAEERRASKSQAEMPPLPGMAPTVRTSEQKKSTSDAGAGEKSTTTKIEQQSSKSKPISATGPKPAAAQETDAPMNLEDFQVPKARLNDLDSFYSDEESDAEADDDDDVVISSASARLAKAASAKYHKQQFLDSDDSDSESEKRAAHRQAPSARPSKQRSPRRHLAKLPTDNNAPVAGTAVTQVGVHPSPPSPVRPPLVASAPRSPASPPRPTISPQHSPRRRVKESQSSTTDEHHSGEQTAEIQLADSSPRLPEQDMAPAIATKAHETLPDRERATTEYNSTVSDPSVVSNGAIEERESVLDVTPIDSSVDVCSVEDADNHDSSVDGGVQDVVEAVELKPAPAEAINNSSEDEEQASRDVSKSSLTPPVTEDDADETELVVPSAAGEIDSFFSDDDDDEERKSSAADQRSSVVVDDAAGQRDEALEETSTTTMTVRVETPAPAHDDGDSGSDGGVDAPRSSGIVSQLKQQQHGVELTLTDDDSDEAVNVPSSVGVKSSPVNMKGKSTSQNRKVEVLASDSEDSDVPPVTSHSIAAPLLAARLQASSDLTSIPSPPLAPAAVNGSGDLGDILESFLNDSGSDSDDVAPKAVVSSTTARAAKDSDEEEEVENDRFAAYDMKRSTQRRSKGSRRRQLDDVVGAVSTVEGSTTASLSSSRTSSFSTTSENTSRQSSIANQDVLAAIRAAELDALKMLEASTPLPSRSSTVATTDHVEETGKKKKKSSSRSSSRKADKEDDNDDDDAGKKKKSKKKKDKEGSSSSRSKRREIILTDEDE